MNTTINIFLGNIIHCTEPFTVHTIEKGFIIVNNKKASIVVINDFFALMEFFLNDVILRSFLF